MSWHRMFIPAAVCAIAISTAQADEASIASGQTADGKMRADILSLKRSDGDTITLRFALTNDSNQPLTITPSLMKLIDLVGRQSYSPGITSSSCHADPGSRAVCWAVFAAPNPNAKSVNVQFYDPDFGLISTPLGN